MSAYSSVDFEFDDGVECADASSGFIDGGFAGERR
jgi:hypothetical protein